MIDGCLTEAQLFAAGPRCRAHKPDHEKYLRAWLAGFHKGDQ